MQVYFHTPETQSAENGYENILEKNSQKSTIISTSSPTRQILPCVKFKMRPLDVDLLLSPRSR